MTKKVKSVEIARHDLILKDISAQEANFVEHKYKYTEYDEQGNITLDITYGENDREEERVENSYDENGRLTEEVFYDEQGDVTERKSYEYDEKGKMQQEYKHYLDGSRDVISYVYNGQDQLMKKIHKDEDDVVEKTEYFKYEGDRPAMTEMFDENNELIYKSIKKYDENGNLVEEAVDDRETFEQYALRHTYDQDGKRIETIRLDKEGNVLEKASFSINPKGEITEAVQETPYNVITTNMEHDAKGNLIKQEEYNGQNQLNHRLERSFDENDNLTESNVFIDFHGEGINRNYLLKYQYNFF